MENVLNSGESKNLENITNEDWPLLKELESTRFSLKNKKSGKGQKSLAAIKNATDLEDSIISQQNMQDEELVGEFLENVSLKETVKIEIESPKKEREVVEPVQLELPLEKNEEVSIEKMFEEAPKNNISKVNNVKIENKEELNNKQEVSKLVVIGLAKIYINKTDSILNPLRFILNNLKQISVALIQFVIPALITWYLVENIPMISSQMSKENSFFYILYVGVFYFACMFLWISGQVLFGGILNMLKYAMRNLEKAGKN